MNATIFIIADDKVSIHISKYIYMSLLWDLQGLKIPFEFIEENMYMKVSINKSDINGKMYDVIHNICNYSRIIILRNVR